MGQAIRTADIQPEEGALLLASFRKVAGVLGLPVVQQATLLGVAHSTLKGWKVAPGSDPDKLDRMALIVGIYDLAAQAFPGERGAEGWLRRPNAAAIFGNQSPLALLLEGHMQGLLRTYDYLQAALRVW